MANDVGGMNIVLSLNAATYTQAIDQATKKLDQMAGRTKQIGHTTITSVQAASGALRELNGDFTNNIRAVERFITTIPGVGDTLKTIFPLVGGVAFGAMIFEAGMKVKQFADELRGVPAAIDKGFGEINAETNKVGVGLDVANDKLGITIAKLEHKPANFLGLALDEDRLAAVNLGEAIDHAADKVDALLQKNSTAGFLKQVGGFVFGDDQKSTAGVEKSIAATFEKLRKAKDEVMDAEDNATPGADAETVKLQGRIKMQNALTEAIAKTSSELGKEQLHGSDGFAGNDAVVKDLQGALRQLQGQQHNFRAGNLQADQTVQERKDQDAQTRAAEASAAARKAAAAQMKGFEDGYADLRGSFDGSHDALLVAEYAFWGKVAGAAAKYPDNLRAVKEKAASVYTEMGAALEEMLRKSDTVNREGARKAAEVIKAWDEQAARLADAMERVDQRGALAMAKMVEVNAKNAAGLAELTRAHDLSTGAISRHAAALQEAGDHAAVYAAQLQQIAADRAASLSKTEFLPGEKDTINREYDAKRAEVQGAADRTAQQDKWRVFQETGLGGAITGLQEFRAELRDTSSQARAAILSITHGLNENILNLVTGQRTNFRGVGQDAAKRVASLSLNKVESSGIDALMKSSFLKDSSLGKLLGIGKGKAPTGTVGDPLNVRVLNMAAANASNAATLAASALPSGFKSLGVGGFLGSIATGLHIPGFAEGVSGFGGGWAMVGERGPELLNLPRGSNITPNRQLGEVMAGGGGDTHVHNWDFRGSTLNRGDVQRMLMDAAPHIVSMSVKAHDQRNARRPSTTSR